MFTIVGLGHQNTHSAEGVLFSAGPLVLLSERNAVLHNSNPHHISVGEEHTSIQNSDLIKTFVFGRTGFEGSKITNCLVLDFDTFDFYHSQHLQILYSIQTISKNTLAVQTCFLFVIQIHEVNVQHDTEA